MAYYYRDPRQEDQRRRVESGAQTDASARSRRGCWITFAVVAAIILIVAVVAVVAVAFTLHTARQLEEEISANSPAVESLLEEHDMSMLDLFLLSRELEGASREEVIQKAEEMGISEQELRELAADGEVRDLIDQFLNR